MVRAVVRVGGRNQILNANTFLVCQRRGIFGFGGGKKAAAEAAAITTPAPPITPDAAALAVAQQPAPTAVVGTEVPPEVLSAIPTPSAPPAWWNPVGHMEAFLNWVPEATGLPGWAVILGAGICLRLALLPLFLKMQRRSAWIGLAQPRLMQQAQPLMAQLQQYREALKSSNAEEVKKAQEEMPRITKQITEARNKVFDEVMPGLRLRQIFIAPLTLMACYSVSAWAIENAIQHQSLLVQSPFLYLPNLMGKDTYFALSMTSALIVPISMEITGMVETISSKFQIDGTKFRRVMYVFAFIGGLLMGKLLPTALILFLLGNAFVHVALTTYLQLETPRRRLGFPELKYQRAAMRPETAHIDYLPYSTNLPKGSKIKPYSKQPYSQF